MGKASLAKIAYQTLQGGKTLAGLAHKELSTRAMEFLAPEAISAIEPISKDLLESVQTSMRELAELDWEEAENNIYPKDLLFKDPWIEWAKNYPLIWLDLPSTWERRKKRNTRDIPKAVSIANYPEYYLQNFHHQTDGYLSDHSAGLYDLQVEILFNGAADQMRRRILKPLIQSLKKFKGIRQQDLRVLDVATGTGRTLHQIRGTFPTIELLGIDLSPSYLKKASQNLNKYDNNLVQLIKGNAEELPFPDESMHVITCVFLFHELPPKVRQNVLNECWRVLKKDGSLILADSIQLADSPNFFSLMDNFHKMFHEPYYKDYINDDIESRLIKSRFNLIEANSYFMTRVWHSSKISEAND